MKIAVVGGGLAGIVAAHTLLKDARVQRVDLFEAQGHYGGRAQTDDQSIPGFAFDLGAVFIHDPSSNPLSHLASQFGLETLSQAPTASLRVLSPQGWIDQAINTPAVQSVVDYVDQCFLDASQEPNAVVCPKPSPHLSDAQALGFAVSPYGPFSESAETWQYVAADRTRENPTGGHARMIVRQGLGTLVRRYAEQLPGLYPERYVAHMATPVRSLHYGTSRVDVGADQGHWAVDACIVTVPVSVLAAGHIQLTPPLPPHVQAALKLLRLGAYRKLALELDTDAVSLKPNCLHYIVNRQPHGVWRYHRMAHQPSVLLAEAAGDFAQALDELSDPEVYQLFTGLIQQAHPDVVFRPDQVATSHWQQIDAIAGACSYSAYNGGGPQDRGAVRARTALVQPQGALWFAGEATRTDCYGSLQAAWFEGERAAQAVLMGASA